MDKHAKPSQVFSTLHRIASHINATQDPSIGRIIEDLGRVVIALESDIPESVESDPEGDLACPRGQMLAHLSHWLGAKYTIDIAYRSFADRTRGPWRDALVDHWYKHSEEERRHAYDLGMKIVGLGGDPAQGNIQIPQCPANLEGFFRTLMSMELEAISAGREAIRLSGGNTGIKVMAENMIVIDTQHLDDLRRMCVKFELPT